MIPGKVLILEKNKSLAILWANYLKRRKLDVKTYIPDVTDKKEIIDWGMPDAIIADLEIKNEVPSGEAYCKQIFGDTLPEEKVLPVIQLYGSFLTETQKTRLQGTAFSLIQKPVSLSALGDAVSKALFKGQLDNMRKNHSAMMTAELSGQALIGIFQFINAGKRSGKVAVESPRGSAMIFFHEAAISFAACQDLAGEEAVLEILTWESGHASFFEMEVAPPQGDTPAEIDALIAEGLREREAIKRVEAQLSRPLTVITRNPDAQISDKAQFSEQLYMALEEPKDLEALKKELSSLSTRQILATLDGMLDRGEVSCAQPEHTKATFSPECCKDFLEALSQPADEIPIATPICLGVCSATPSLATKFIGNLDNHESANDIIMAAEEHELLVSKVTYQGDLKSFSRYSGIIVVFDRNDAENLAETKKLLKEIRDAQITAICVGLVSNKESATSPAELLGVTSADIKFVPIEWTQASCLKAIAALFESELERSE